MRVLVLGGAGAMGRVAARVLAAADGVTRVVVADLDGGRADAVARSLGDKAFGRRVDVTDRAALAAVLGECDVVVNTVGPFFRFGTPILTAAVAAGRDYVDICDDWEPTVEMLELDERARAAGVTALVGMGASPGVANLLAVLAGRELDSVDSVVTGWNIADAAQPDSARTGQPSAAVVHGMRQISGTIRILRDGGFVQSPALEKVDLDYPGIGPIRGRSFGHPEAVTLHRAFPGLRANVNIAVGDRLTFAALSALRFGMDRRLLTQQRAARLAVLAEHVLPGSPADIIKPAGPPPLFALASGVRAGEPATAATALAQIPGLSMAENTGVPLAVATLLLPSMRRPGVHPPETLIDPDAFFAAFAPHCIGKPAATAMTVTTRSWSTPEANAENLGATLLTAFLVPPSR
ncbi:saccharopine dehydrogenase NADP-binding domain-containing protein [Nocardia sp. 2]|uniref:Saccharopine dehydrogenase NADP-binding domain-containing protein n=1 Tax=Nocardia acididurans TaxID=2802282 RepID=A0ABS1M2R4_9NOCA|nr:saccharopine dehydrogenase NADP-binding domain-containing protein [Nocardia acididurans]MBL1074816.1 saccharopine dehydrogenase NADP-binding domain-containing protein [Nocardia acididurans]